MSLNVRISHKYDSYENWMKSTIVLNAGELAICEIPSQQVASEGDTNGVLTPPAIGIKVGDGEKTFSQLAWIQATAGDVYSWAKEAKKPEYTAEEIKGLETFIAGEIQDTNTTYSFAYENNKLIVKSREKTDAEGEYPTTVAEIAIDLTTKVDKVAGTEGNIVNFGKDGAIVDSGEKIGDFLKSGDAEDIYATIANLEKTDENVSKLSGRMDTAEGEIDALQEQIKGLAGAMHFEGAVDSDPTVDGFNVEGYENGDVVVYGSKEYVFYNGAFYEFGDVSAEGQRLEALETAVGKASKGTAGQEGYEAGTGLTKRVEDAEDAIAALEEDSHTHTFDEEVLNGITADKVDKWDEAADTAATNKDTLISLIKEDGRLDTIEKDISDLKDTVGDASKGLVKGVADNAAAIESLGENLTETDGIARTALQTVSGVEGTKTGTDFKVTGVSTDLLKNGSATLVLNCGTASTVI